MPTQTRSPTAMRRVKNPCTQTHCARHSDTNLENHGPCRRKIDWRRTAGEARRTAVARVERKAAVSINRHRAVGRRRSFGRRRRKSSRAAEPSRSDRVPGRPAGRGARERRKRVPPRIRERSINRESSPLLGIQGRNQTTFHSRPCSPEPAPAVGKLHVQKRTFRELGRLFDTGRGFRRDEVQNCIDVVGKSAPPGAPVEHIRLAVVINRRDERAAHGELRRQLKLLVFSVHAPSETRAANTAKTRRIFANDGKGSTYFRDKSGARCSGSSQEQSPPVHGAGSGAFRLRSGANALTGSTRSGCFSPWRMRGRPPAIASAAIRRCFLHRPRVLNAACLQGTFDLNHRHLPDALDFDPRARPHQWSIRVSRSSACWRWESSPRWRCAG